MRYYIVDAFSDKPFGGNTAGVVLIEGDEFPDDGVMRNVAAELRYSETAFVMRHSASEFTLRYFTPKDEVALCGHATIASFATLHSECGVEGRCLCHTKAGDLQVVAGRRVMMQMAPPRIVATIDHVDEIYRALGVDDFAQSLPVQIAYSGLSDIMIPLPSLELLQSLHPDMEAIAAITRKQEAVSFHVFAFGNDAYTAHVRDFAPLYDIDEESATGTANAALTHYLRHNGCIAATGDFHFLQGEAMGRPSVVSVSLYGDGDLYVGGTAAVVAKGELCLNPKQPINR